MHAAVSQKFCDEGHGVSSVKELMRDRVACSMGMTVVPGHTGAFASAIEDVPQLSHGHGEHTVLSFGSSMRKEELQCMAGVLRKQHHVVASTLLQESHDGCGHRAVFFQLQLGSSTGGTRRRCGHRR